MNPKIIYLINFKACPNKCKLLNILMMQWLYIAHLNVKLRIKLINSLQFSKKMRYLAFSKIVEEYLARILQTFEHTSGDNK